MIAYDAFQTKPDHFGKFWHLVQKKAPPSSRMGTYWKTEGIQSYLGTRRRYDPIKSSLSESKNGIIWGQKLPF